MSELNIYQRLMKVTEEVEAIPKNGTNTFSNYKYVRAVDAIGYVKKLLVKYGIVLTITEIECIRTPKKEDGKNFHTQIKCQATFRCADNPNNQHTVDYYSISADTLDKDIFKAKTNGLKYLFSQQFLMITNDFIDTEDDSNIKPEKGSKQNDDFISKEKVVNITKLIKESGVDSIKFLTHFKAETVDTFLESNYKPAIDALNARIAENKKGNGKP